MHSSSGRPRTLVLASALALIAGLVHAAPARADEPAVGVNGTVRDSAGTPLPNVQVVVAELGRVTTTDAAGAFVLRGLPAATYHLNAILIGYAPAHVTVVVPETGSDVRVEIVMRATPLRISGVVVTASPTGTDPLNVTQATVELSGKELARNLGASVAQTLGNEPGMATRFNGPAAAAPVIRGLTGERILVLQDGERTGDLASPSSDHAVTVDPMAAQRIEVVRGPASLLYGNNALGGVVNVISNDIPTEVPRHIEGYVGGQAESVNPGAASSASLNIPIAGGFALGLRGGVRSNGDVRVGGEGELENTSSRNFSGVVGLGWIGERVTAGLAFRGLDFEYGLPAAPDAEEAGIRLDGRREQVSYRTTVDLGQGVVPTVRVDGTAQWYTHDEIENTGEIGTTFKLNTQTVNATARTQFGRIRGAIGAQGLFRQYAPEGEEALTPSANSTSGGAFLYQEIALRDGLSEIMTPRLQLGARWDTYRLETETTDVERFGEGRSRTFGNLSGSVGLSLALGRGYFLSGSVARAFRAPSVEELYSNGFHAATGAFEIGDPDLDAETNAGFETVLRVQSRRLSGQLAAYYNRIDNYIAPAIQRDTVLDEEGTVPLARFAQDDAAIRGVEAQIEAHLTRAVVLGAMADAIRGSYVDGGPLPYMPPGRVGGSLRWDDNRFSVGGEVRHGFAQRRVPEGELATDAYTLVNLSAGLNLVMRGYVHSFMLRADNVFDEEYRDAASRIKSFALNPGANFSLVYRVLF